MVCSGLLSLKLGQQTNGWLLYALSSSTHPQITLKIDFDFTTRRAQTDFLYIVNFAVSKTCTPSPPIITLLADARLDISRRWLQTDILGLRRYHLHLSKVTRTFGWNSLAAGLFLLSLVIPICRSPLVGWLSNKHGPRWYVSAIPLLLLV